MRKTQGKEHNWGQHKQYSPFFGRQRFHKNTAHARLLVSTSLHVEHRRPKAGDAPHEGLLKVKRGNFGVQVLGFGSLRF